MKKWITIFLVVVSAATSAQTDSNLSNAALDQEKARITAARELLDRELTQQEVACYQRFAVNPCLAKARAAHHQDSSDLRRQEVVINDIRRRAQGEAQQARIDERLAQQQAAAAARAASSPAVEKKPDLAGYAASERQRAELRRASRLGRKRANDAEIASRAALAAEIPANKAAYAKKLEKAASYRAQQEALNKENASKRAAGLPQPAASAAFRPAGSAAQPASLP